MSALPKLSSDLLETGKQDAVNDPKVPVSSVEKIDKAIAGEPACVFIKQLWNDPDNKTVIDKFMRNQLCWNCARAPNNKENLEAFRQYALQDYFYLVDYVKFRALRFTLIPQGDLPAMEKEASSIGGFFKYIENEWVKKVLEPLGVKAEIIKSTERSVAEMAYAGWLQSQAGRQDWFNMHVAMIACQYGWSKLALELYDHHDTVRDSVFFKEWILPNVTFERTANEKTVGVMSNSAVKLSNFLDLNRDLWAAEIDSERWKELFRTSLRLETALFDSAYSPYGK